MARRMYRTRRLVKRANSLLLLVALSACTGSPPPQLAATAPSFDPIKFFAGHTEGVGRLRVMLSRTRSVHVQGDGDVEQDGSLMLVQHIEQQGKADRTRRWSIRSTGPGTYSGELTDAVGPVLASASGNVLRLRFTAKGGLHIQQWLALEPNGRIVRNHLVVRKLGIRVATLDETIRKLD